MSPGNDFEVSSLDAFVESHSLQRLDVVKVDIEGAEGLFIQGAIKTLGRFKPAIMELLPSGLKKYGSTPESILASLSSFGYDFYDFHWTGTRRLRVPPEIREDSFLNVAALPRGKAQLNVS
jgi:hypothetical protein